MIALPPPPPALIAQAPPQLFAVEPTPTVAMAIINRARFQLKYYVRTPEGFKRRFVYKVAVGMPQYPTPAGTFVVQRHALNPTWTAPDSPWVTAVERGKTFDGDTPGHPNPRNPIVGAFIAIDGTQGLGIHGTRDVASLGTRASHGCIRMTRAAARSLFFKLPIGSPVVIE